MVSCGQQLGYGDLIVGDNFLKAVKSYQTYKCEVNTDTKNCVVHNTGETIYVGVNKDNVIYSVEINSLVDGLTFSQVTDKFASKYGNKYESHTLNFEPKGVVRWCFTQDCLKVLAVSYFSITPRDKLKVDDDFFIVSPCDTLFKNNKKCDESTNYIKVEYSDHSISKLWINKEDKQLNKF